MPLRSPSTLWYALQIALAARVRHRAARVSIGELRRGLALYHHSLGGSLARGVVGDAGTQPRASLLSDVLGDLRSWLDAEQVHLPQTIDRYAARELNRELYFWLAAYLAEEQAAGKHAPLPRGVQHLLRGVATSARVQQQFPALAPRYRRLCVAELEQRRNVLPNWDANSNYPAMVFESAIRYALGSGVPAREAWLMDALSAAQTGEMPHAAAPARYRAWLPYLPVALWEHAAPAIAALRLRRFKRPRQRRAVGARSALARPRFDPTLRVEQRDGARAEGEFVYPEWRHAERAYQPDWCVVNVQVPPARAAAMFDLGAAAYAQRVRCEFEALRQINGWRSRLEAGSELDVDRYVDSIADARGSGVRSERIHRERAPRWRELSVALLLDTSRSTQAWVGERRSLGIARDAALVLAEALTAAGDEYGLFAFCSDTRLRVNCYQIKDFSERYGESVRARLLALQPAGYTRMGAALRHVGIRLQRRAPQQKLLLMLSDGRPHDPADGYEGVHALEDTRRAVMELRAGGVHCFGLTIDARGGEYLPHLFGPGHSAVIADARALPSVLPKLYARIAARA